jgi:hypothetical protein
MRLIRERLVWLIAAWLTCQVAGIAAAPVTFGCQVKRAVVLHASRPRPDLPDASVA